MNALKCIVNNKILKVISLKNQQKCFFKLSALNAAEPKPVKMSFATYETTKSAKSAIPPLIILHGLFGSKTNWNSICKALLNRSKPTRKIIAIDARNHGESPHTPEHGYEEIAADIKYLMEIQKIPKAILLGHSMGGKSVMYFALKYSNLVDRLIVVDIVPTSKSVVVSSSLKMMDVMSKLKVPSNIPISSARVQADKLLSKSIPDKGVRAFLLTNLIKNANGSYGWRLNLPALIKYFQKLATFPSVGATKFTGATLFISGGSSDFVQKQDMVATKIIFPKAQFISIAGAGHWVHSEKPNEFIGHILNFINDEVSDKNPDEPDEVLPVVITPGELL